MKIKEAIDTVISHNAKVAILVDEYDNHYSRVVWEGMAHSIPEEYLNIDFKPISDYINYDKNVAEHPIHIELKQIDFTLENIENIVKEVMEEE